MNQSGNNSNISANFDTSAGQTGPADALQQPQFDLSRILQQAVAHQAPLPLLQVPQMAAYPPVPPRFGL